jgi:hypothetical protein
MKIIKSKIAGVVLITSLLVTGCSLGANTIVQPTQDPAIFYTQAAGTMSVETTLVALANLSNQPTYTQAPTYTPFPTPTIEQVVVVPDSPTISVEIPTEEATETPEPQTPMLHVTVDTNCRAGPSPAYGVEGYVTTDMTLPVRGISDGRSWWWVDNPTYPGFHCWVWKQTSIVEGDTSNVPVYRAPWTMTPADPIITANIYAWTGNQKGKCPITVTFSAIIKSNRAAQVAYMWLRKGQDKSTEHWVAIAANSQATVSYSFNVKDDAYSSYTLHILAPVRLISNKVTYRVKCTKN